jgi:YVTN family beta-propeller protein
VTGSVPVGTNPLGAAVTLDSSQVYVTSIGSDEVSVVDAATRAVTATIPVGADPTGVAFSLTPVPAPVVTSVSPNSGAPAGGNTVTVGGSHLSGATAVTFGPGHPASGVSCTDTACAATVPAGATGTVDVQVTTAGGTSAVSAADHYTYTVPPAADIAVTLAATPVPALLGAHIDYTLTIADQGPGAVGSSTVTVTVPNSIKATTSDCTATAGKVTCTTGAVANGAKATRHFTVPVGLLSINLPYSVTATRTASSPTDPNPADDHATRTCTVVTSLLISCT